MNTIIRCCFICFAFVSLYYAEGVEDYQHLQNYQEAASAKVPQSVKKPKTSKAKLSEASNPEYDISKTQFRVKNHPRIHLQAPEVRFVYPSRRKPTYSYPRNYHYYGSGFPNDYPQYYPRYNAYDYDRFPRFQMISSPGVWMDQARHSLYGPKLRVKRPPQYPIEPKVEVEKTGKVRQDDVKQVKDEIILNKNPTEYHTQTEPYNGVAQQ